MKFIKDSLRYWENQIFKNKYKYKGKVRNSGTYCAKIMYEGKRVTFNLKTGNKAKAAVLAKEIYQKHSPKGMGPSSVLGQNWENYEQPEIGCKFIFIHDNQEQSVMKKMVQNTF